MDLKIFKVWGDNFLEQELVFKFRLVVVSFFSRLAFYMFFFSCVFAMRDVFGNFSTPSKMS